MKRSFLFLLILVVSLIIAGCASDTANKNSSGGIKRGVAPVADAEAVVLETEYGPIKIELYSNIAPKHVARFKELVREGFYDGIEWHRINPQVIQAGNAATKTAGWAPGQGEVGSGKPNVEAEFSDLKYEAGTLGGARLNDPNSFNSQFFITLTRVPAFETKYTIFGKVTDGLNTVMTLSGVPREGERPVPAVRIKKATIQPK